MNLQSSKRRTQKQSVQSTKTVQIKVTILHGLNDELDLPSTGAGFDDTMGKVGDNPVKGQGVSPLGLGCPKLTNKISTLLPQTIYFKKNCTKANSRCTD